ncbi:MAG: DUF3820 family protein [Flavobacteriaceae bacterium]|nr:DUF3820 family protein [Flavobacteriaceae bacterium]
MGLIENRAYLLEVVNTKMPFGKYKGKYILDLPEYYIFWYKQKGFPKGKIGDMMALVCEIKTNGLDRDLRKLRN